MLRRSLQANLELYPLYAASKSLLFWIPVFFIYFSSRLTVDEVLWLEAIYYFTNVVFEVPSGYFSDRFGRRRTLILAALAFFAGYMLLAMAVTFAEFVVGQCLVAAGFAFNSGTDTSLLYDSLIGVDKGHELAKRESRAWAVGFVASAFAAVVGGLMAGIDLRLGYGLSAGGAVLSLVLALFLVEPPKETSASAAQHLLQTFRYVAQPLLLWLFIFAVAMRVFEHIPYLFFQPYLELLFGSGAEVARTPAVSGALVACMTLASAGASLKAPGWRRRFGTTVTLLVSLSIYGLICGLMATWLHPAILLVLALRSVPHAIANPVLSAAIHPRIASETRATYLSVQNLAGSLTFSAVLALTAHMIGPLEHLAFPALANVLLVFTLGVAICVGILAFFARRLQNPSAQETDDEI